MSIKHAISINHPNKRYQFVDDGNPIRGGVKDVYFSPDRKYVIGFYRNALDFNGIERLKRITMQYYDSFFNRAGGDYYQQLYAWPSDVVKDDLGRVGVVVPCYSKNFFFKKGYALFDSIKGAEKQGKWFASPKFRVASSRFRLDQSELGDWLSYFQICTHIARGVKRMHAAGLAHSDLSYKNVLIDPLSSRATIIDIDGLVVPHLFAPEVLGTPDFIAPEVMKTIHLGVHDKNRHLPNRLTDLHALAVLIYMYLLYRHPLRGGQFLGADIDAEDEEKLVMGERALFIEHPTNHANRNFKREYGEEQINNYSPYLDLQKTPHSITGPYLSALFKQAFVDGLHDPVRRPPAQMWEEALIKTNDLKLSCSNRSCPQKWFIYTPAPLIRCPFCDTRYVRSIPLLDFYSHAKGSWVNENMRMAVYHHATLHHWHTDKRVIRNERLTDPMKERLGYFVFHQGSWFFVNEKICDMFDLSNNVAIAQGKMVLLQPQHQLRFGNKHYHRFAKVFFVNQ